MGRVRLVGYCAAGGGAILLLATFLLWGRLGHYGSYAEFHQGRALDIMEVKLGYVMVAVAIGTVASASFVAPERQTTVGWIAVRSRCATSL